MKITTKEAKYLKETISMLSSMVNSGEEHSGMSRDRVGKAINMLDEKPDVVDDIATSSGWGF